MAASIRASQSAQNGAIRSGEKGLGCTYLSRWKASRLMLIREICLIAGSGKAGSDRLIFLPFPHRVMIFCWMPF